MKVKIIQKHWLPTLLNVTGITLYPYILLSDSYEDAEANHILNHEFIHVAQIRKVGAVKFYATYLYDYLRMYLKLRNKQQAYLNIPVESEAYRNQDSVTHPKVSVVNGILREM